LLVAVALVLAAPAHAATGDLLLESRATGLTGAGADGESYQPSTSAEGRFVAFASAADNLSPEDNDRWTNVFVRDKLTHTTSYVSRATGALGAATDTDSSDPSISADGRFVAFVSSADNLSAACDTTVGNIFVRDLRTNTTTYLSRATGADGTAGDGNSFDPSISADGRFVAFASDADSVSDQDTNTTTDVFVRDLQTHTTRYVTRATGAAGSAGDGESLDPSISADGRFVAFRSEADSLSSEDDDTIPNVFVRDLQTNTTTYVSRATGAAGTAGGGIDPSISADGRSVAFASAADNLSSEDNDAVGNVFVRDLPTNTTTYVSRATGPTGMPGDDSSFEPSISGDGRWVAFSSFAHNLNSDDHSFFADVFLRDLQTNTTTYLSRATGPAGAPGDATSFDPSISADGRFVAFFSDADSLSGEDSNAVSNVFLRQVLDAAPPPPTPTPTPTPPFYPTPTPVSPPTNDNVKPLISKLSLSPRSFGAAGRGPSVSATTGTKLSYRLSERATVRFGIERGLPGRRSRAGCVALKRSNRSARRCTRYRLLRRGFTRRGKRGQNRFRFRGRLSGHALKPGRYRLRALATDSAGNKSRRKRSSFRVFPR